MSNLSIFKIGVGPSSSHTVGPMVAGNLFCSTLESKLQDVVRVHITLYGSLSLTDRGHLTDKAIIWGLNNFKAQNITADLQHQALNDALELHKLNLCGKKEIAFDYEKCGGR